MTDAPPASPFKFLDSFDSEDQDRFFGRERETGQLYNAVHASNLVLLYGASGTGKTSLVDCGLANRFEDTDWFPIRVRRDHDLNLSLRSALTIALESPDAVDPDADIAQLVEQVYFDHYRPVYLIFDQFEELYILGSPEEQEKFHATVSALLGPGPPAKLLIIVREEYIGILSDFERAVPGLFDNRLRIEQMNDRNLTRVVAGMTRAGGVEIQDGTRTVRSIIEHVRDPRHGVDLADLQVYLDRLFKEGVARSNGDADHMTFDTELVDRVGRFGRVLSDFLDEQMARLESELEEIEGEPTPGVPLEILFAMVTQERTKRTVDLPEIRNALPPNRRVSERAIQYCLDDFARIKLVRPLPEVGES